MPAPAARSISTAPGKTSASSKPSTALRKSSAKGKKSAAPSKPDWNDRWNAE